MKIGDVVQIRQGATRRIISTGNIKRISPTGLVATVTYSNGRERRFYKNKHTERYVFEPGCGFAGSMLNDYFIEEKLAES